MIGKFFKLTDLKQCYESSAVAAWFLRGKTEGEFQMDAIERFICEARDLAVDAGESVLAAKLTEFVRPLTKARKQRNGEWTDDNVGPLSSRLKKKK